MIFRKARFFQWFLLIKTIETCFDHREAKSAIRTILQKATPSARRDLEEGSVEWIRWVRKNEYTVFSLITTFLRGKRM